MAGRQTSMTQRNVVDRSLAMTSLSSVEVRSNRPQDARQAAAPKSGTFFAENAKPKRARKVDYLDYLE